MINVLFNLGYFVMAFPAAMFIQRYSFKAGVMVGLALYAAGSLLFFPAQGLGAFGAFLFAYFIMACGLSFLETSCNPFIYSMGSEETAVRRLNMAQAFNPIGALVGLFISMNYVQTKISPMTKEMRENLPLTQFNIIRDHDLEVLIQPYLFIAIVTLAMLVLIRLKKMPSQGDEHSEKNVLTAISELLHIKNFRNGIIAQFFYVGGQVAVWTFTVQYAANVFISEGIYHTEAEMMAQKYNILALVFFAIGRFVCTWLMKFVRPGRLLTIFGVVATIGVAGAIVFTDRNGIYCLILTSAAMSLMFPTIFGMALRGVGQNVKFAGAGLIMAILGGSVFSPLQAALIDLNWSLGELPAINISFIVPLLCFAYVAYYGHTAYMRHNVYHDYNADLR